MPIHRFSIVQYLSESRLIVIKALIAGLILGFLDFYVGYFGADMSIRTFVLFFALYGFGCILVALLLGTVIHLFADQSRRPVVLSIGYILLIGFFLNFVYINVQFFEIFNFDNPIGIVTNLTLIIGTIVSAKVALTSRRIEGFVSNVWRYSLACALVFCVLSNANYFLLNWPEPLQNVLLAVALAAFIAITPALCIYLASVLQHVLDSQFKRIVWMNKLFLPASILIAVLMIPHILRFPLLGIYEEGYGEITDSDLTKGNGQRPNIIWIVMDTARKDRFSCYGYGTHRTPNVDEFSKDAVMFLDAVSAAPWTLPSHASMFTGTYPSQHGAHFSEDGSLKHPLINENVTIAEILKVYDYKTAAFVANYGALNSSHGFGQGFDLYYDEPSRIFRFFWGEISSRLYSSLRYKNFPRINRFLLSSEINPMALHWVRKNKANSFFLFINYMECHAGYKYLPGKFNREYDLNSQMASKLFTQMDKQRITQMKRDITPAEHEALLNPVDSRLKYLDDNLGKFFDSLKEMKVYDDALIIVTSDHGTLKGEHNAFGHSSELYNELINIPLIIKYPRGTNRRGVSNAKVQSVDIMAEILDYLNIRAHEGIQGQPFNEVTHSTIAEVFRRKSNIITGLNPERFYRDLKAIYSSDGKYKYIQSSNGQSMLFDLAEEPSEENNLLGQMPELARSLDNKLSEWQKSITPMVDESTINKIDKEKLERDLRSLGYIK
jgi:arylsulfatase A-like enzyme